MSTTSTEASSATPAITPVPAKAPAAAPATIGTGVVLALLLLALAAVLVRDTLVSAGLVTGPSWLAWFADKATVISASSPWMVWAGPLAVIIGLLLLVAALKPRRSTHWAVGDQGVHIGRRDAARLAAHAAGQAPGVVDADASVSGRHSVQVSTATISTDTAAVTRDVDEAVRRRLEPLRPAPSVRSRVTLKES